MYSPFCLLHTSFPTSSSFNHNFSHNFSFPPHTLPSFYLRLHSPSPSHLFQTVFSILNFFLPSLLLSLPLSITIPSLSLIFPSTSLLFLLHLLLPIFLSPFFPFDFSTFHIFYSSLILFSTPSILPI